MLPVETLRSELATWYANHRRELPWREEPTGYRVWVSEIMLQQTQVATVIPYFDTFMTRFPNLESLACADESDVLAAWSGLGYYRRARLLHQGVKTVMETLGGEIPRRAKELLALPGIGPYTAGAIASIAFGEPVPLVDGNVNRVLTRLVGDDTPVDTAAGRDAMWALAERLLNRSDPSAHNQSMMELGALVCSPKAPDCPRCPWRDTCAAHATGETARYPVKKGRTKVKPIWAVCGVAQREDGALLLARRPDDALLGGMWEFPQGAVERADDRRDALAQAWRERLGLMPEILTPRGQVKHVFTHRRLTLDVFDVKLKATPAARAFYTDVRWVTPDDWRDLPVSRLARKVHALTEVGRV